MVQPYKDRAATGTKKALGQLKKVQDMLDEGKYCMDILQQIRAVEGLLRSISSDVLESHLQTCGQRAFSSKNKHEQEKVIQELVTAFRASKK